MYIVYKHVRKDTNRVCYYGCGQGKRPWQKRYTGSEHEALRFSGKIHVMLLREFENRQDALRYEASLIRKARSRGIQLFNKVVDGVDHSRSLYRAKIGLGALSKVQRIANGRTGGRAAGRMPWWHHPITGVTKRGYVAPTREFVRGRGYFPSAVQIGAHNDALA